MAADSPVVDDAAPAAAGKKKDKKRKHKAEADAEAVAADEVAADDAAPVSKKDKKRKHKAEAVEAVEEGAAAASALSPPSTSIFSRSWSVCSLSQLIKKLGQGPER